MEIGPNSFSKSVYILCKNNSTSCPQHDVVGVYDNYSSVASAKGFNSNYYIIGPVPFYSNREFKIIEHPPFGDLGNFPGPMNIE